MGGHGLARGTDGYAEAAELGKTLAQAGYLVATGGGPGAMEAVNLGAFVAGRTAPADTDTALRTALDRLATVPDFTDISRWATVARQVRDALPDKPDAGGQATVAGIGVPTWFYGHEPPNLFADRIAKYFANAIREDILLARASAGVLVLPGAAGTVQEIFQAATRSFYATSAPPIVLLDGNYWRDQLPAWQLLSALAATSAGEMSSRVAICDGTDQALQHLSSSGATSAGSPAATPTTETGTANDSGKDAER
nr:LOG family protein [Nakamurella aerolata]